MSIFIKACLWVEKTQGYLGEFNLTCYIEYLIEQNQFTLTTNGTSGAATFENNILNIPQYDDSTGTSGTSGTSGINGTSGIDGTSGTNGSSGSSGVNGTTGSSGSAGSSGTSGTSAIDGTSGTSGATGSSGSAGTSGLDGTSGTSGTTGTSGLSTATTYSETPIGLVNSSNTIFTLANPVINTAAVLVLLDGVTQYNGIDYSVFGNTITFISPPITGSTIFVYYNFLAGGTGGSSGSSGTSGNGTSGLTGTSGINGTNGTSGINGSSGVDGTSGTSEASGLTQMQVESLI